jgi:branched-subunit amino acid transport protein
MFLLLGARTLPPWTERPMSLVAPAALAALVGSMVMTQHGAVQVLPLPELLAVVAGFLAVRRSGNVMHAFTVGMPVLWTTTWALG